MTLSRDPPGATLLHPSRAWSRLANRSDLAWSLCLALATIVYLWFWPRDLDLYDESILLYEAKRILEGDVLYRDFVDIVTPGAWYLMAAVFRIFGTSIETARGTMSILHALSVVVVFLSARALGLRRILAVIPAVAYVALSYANFAYASPHWFATFFALVLLLVLLTAPTSGPWQARGMFVLGMVASCGLAFQQQRGAALAVGLPVLIFLDQLWRRPTEGSGRSIGYLLGAYFAGALVVGIPLLVYLIAVPGFGPAYDGLVHVPLFRYATHHTRISWGQYPHHLAVPWVVPELKYLPVLLPAEAVTLLVDRLRGAEWRALRQRIILLLFCMLVIPTILHNPDYVHIALIAPFFFVLASELLDWMVRQLRAPIAAWVRMALAAGLLAGLAYQAGLNVLESRRSFPLSHATAFGAVSFARRDEIRFIDRLRAEIDASSSKEIFVYPHSPGIYLLTGAKNATRYSLLIWGYHPDDVTREIVATLDSKRTPFIVFGLSEEPETEFTKYRRSTYERVRLPVSSHFLFQRKP